ncbi:hypothetical protein [Vibrio scophthalmi]|uniref:Uncharacterized protein n=2 Tax=Vibrio scophthalmi TaxID=45658 RepID=A0A1C7F622_9VIBR|nr:hypothetical protein [Vibrio scophthalmi]ANU35382.1 hypothetical protein VSVS05_00238 [Vibrio scophthalmi]
MTSNRTLPIKFIIFIGLLSFVGVVGYKFITEGIQDAVIFTPVVDDFMWGTLCSLIGALFCAGALYNKSVPKRLWNAVKGIFFLVGGLSMLFDGVQAVF